MGLLSILKRLVQANRKAVIDGDMRSADPVEEHRGLDSSSAERSVAEQFEVQGFTSLRKAAERGDAGAQCLLGHCYATGEGIDKDQREAIKWFRKAAEQGHAEAQYGLGDCYHGGKGVDRDMREAVKWLRKAAEQGHAEAQFKLSFYYYTGEGVGDDKREAVTWARRAAEQGHPEAQYRLGRCYYEGDVVEKDHCEAVKWLRKAAEQGHSGAQCNVGLCYYTGKGLKQDDREAVDWFRRAAEQDHPVAEDMLGYCYQKGKGVTRDEREAIKWFRKAAEQGNDGGQYHLGLCYLYGEGVERDNNSADAWLEKAAKQGDPEALKVLTKLRQCVGVIRDEVQRRPPSTDSANTVSTERGDVMRIISEVGGDDTKARQLIASLRDKRDETSFSVLVALLEDKNDLFSSWVVGCAAEALGGIGDPRAVKPMIEAMKNHMIDGDVSKAIVKLGQPAVEDLIAAMCDGSDRHRFRLRYLPDTLAEIGGPRAQESLIAVVFGEDPHELRLWSAVALLTHGWRPSTLAERAAIGKYVLPVLDREHSPGSDEAYFRSRLSAIPDIRQVCAD